MAVTYSLDSHSPALSATTLSGAWLSPDESSMYVVVDNYYINQYSLSTPGDPTTASYVAQFSITNGDWTESIWMMDDGTAVFCWGKTANVYGVTKYTMSTPWDITTAIRTSGKALNVEGLYEVVSGGFIDDGSTMFAIDRYGLAKTYALSTAYDPTTATVDTGLQIVTADLGGSSIWIRGAAFRADTLIVLNNYNGAFFARFSLTGGDLSTASSNGVDYTELNEDYYLQKGFAFNSDWSACYLATWLTDGVIDGPVVAKYTVDGLAAAVEINNIVALSMPCFEMGLESGSQLALDMPSFEMGMTMYQDSIGAIGLDMPCFEIGLTGTAPHLSYLALEMPCFEVGGEASIGLYGDIALNMPCFEMGATGYSGDTEIGLTMPMFELLMHSDNGDGWGVLRYVRGTVH